MWCGKERIRYTSLTTIMNGRIPIHDDRLLFEFLILEGAQVGLSGMTP